MKKILTLISGMILVANTELRATGDSNNEYEAMLQDTPPGGLNYQLERIADAIDNFCKMVTGMSVLEPYKYSTPSEELGDEGSGTDAPEGSSGGGGSGEGSLQSAIQAKMVPLRFENTDHSLIIMKDQFNIKHYLEVIKDSEQGGEALYTDRKGQEYKVQWNNLRVVTNDSSPHHILGGLHVPEVECEPRQMLQDAIGLTSTVVSRTPNGGIIKKSGAVASNITSIQKCLNDIKKSIPPMEDFRMLEGTSSAGFARLLNQMDRLEQMVKGTDARIDHIEHRINQLLVVIVELSNCALGMQNIYSTSMNPDSAILVPKHWNEHVQCGKAPAHAERECDPPAHRSHSREGTEHRNSEKGKHVSSSKGSHHGSSSRNHHSSDTDETHKPKPNPGGHIPGPRHSEAGHNKSGGNEGSGSRVPHRGHSNKRHGGSPSSDNESALPPT
ncbi:MAG: hypothetical protein LBQ43_02300 [Holosporales bacterium]|jgi:hypothetical protein|nr:hypothetical protein [Holosporales bacterium]